MGDWWGLAAGSEGVADAAVLGVRGVVVERVLCRLECVSVGGDCRTTKGVLDRWLWLWWLLSSERERGGGRLVERWSPAVRIYGVALVVSFG